MSSCIFYKVKLLTFTNNVYTNRVRVKENDIKSNVFRTMKDKNP